MPEESHSTALKEVGDLIAGLRGHSWRTHQEGPVRGDPGLPDMWITARRNAGRPHVPVPGEWVAFWYECKVGKDTLSPAQIGFKVSTEKGGVAVVVGRPADVAEFLGY